jgi:rod shape-determining protein MreC
MNFINRKLIIIAALVALPLISVNLQQRTKDDPWILVPFYYAATLTQNSYASFSSGVRGTTDLYLNLVNIKKENRQIHQRLLQLEAELAANTELKLENERLSHLLDFKQKVNMNLLAARIIGRDLLTDYDTVTIDRGHLNGVKKGMGVIAINGVVGYAIEVESHTTKVLLITDRNAVIDGIVQRSRARGILQGFNRETCHLSFLKRGDDVQKGDTIVTSGIDNYFPKGFPVATVEETARDEYGLGQNVTVQPIVNAANLEEVFVILNANSQDFEKLAENEKAAAEKVITDKLIADKPEKKAIEKVTEKKK